MISLQTNTVFIRLTARGAYSRWALIKFSPFSARVACLFCNKSQRCNKARFLYNTLKKTPSLGKVSSSSYSIFYLNLSGRGRGVGWAERLLTFSAFRMGVYSRWALIRSWAPIRINTVIFYWKEKNASIEGGSWGNARKRFKLQKLK